jgi:hypothetical protein
MPPPPPSVISRNVEELHTTQDTEEIVDELAANQSGVTLMGDSVEAVDHEQALQQIGGSDLQIRVVVLSGPLVGAGVFLRALLVCLPLPSVWPSSFWL